MSKSVFERSSDAVEDALASDDNHPDDIARAVLISARDAYGQTTESGWWLARAVDDILKEPPAT